MPDVPNPVTSTFIAGLAGGILLAVIALWLWRRWRARTIVLSVIGPFAELIPPEIDSELRARSTTFAERTGRPSAAPLVYSAIRDLTIARGRYARRLSSEHEPE